MCLLMLKTEQCTFGRFLLLHASAEFNELVLTCSLLHSLDDVTTKVILP